MAIEKLETNTFGKRKVAVLNYSGVLTPEHIEKLQERYQERLGIPVIVMDGGVRLDFVELD